MAINTFFWNDPTIGQLEYLKNKWFYHNPNKFRFGNSGDIFVRDLIKYIYDDVSINTSMKNSRLLLVGSIAHRLNVGDVVCGVGTKGKTIPSSIPRENILVWGLRGPITYDEFKKEGFNVSNVKFLLDPGLMLKFLIPKEYLTIEPKKISFIPHYRERFNYIGKLPKEFNLVDIDSQPLILAKEILASKIIYTSSLHGIIFSHSLGRPCIFVKPQSDEPLIKFEDYYLSIGEQYPKPLDSVFDFNFLKDSDSVVNYCVQEKDFSFPSLDLLKQRMIKE